MDDLSNDDLTEEFVDVEQLQEDFTFTQRLANYYSDFLSTDFKKGSLPKRRFQTRDKKGRRSGITLEKFSTFIPVVNKVLFKEFAVGHNITIAPDRHVAQLPNVVLIAVEAEIKKIKFEDLKKRNDKSIEQFCAAVEKKDADLEIECQKFTKAISRNVGLVVGAELINKLEPVFERSASNLVDALVAVDDDIAELIVSPIEESLPTVLYSIMSENDKEPLNELINDAFEEEKLRRELEEYFEAFSAGDLATELRELHNLEQLEENLEYYLYLGEIRHKNHEFPLFYIPFSLDFEGGKADITFEPRLLANKKAVDYIARVIQEETRTQRASAIENRIIYLDQKDKVFQKANDLLAPILRAFDFDGDLSFGGPRKKLKKNVSGTPEITVTNSLNFAIFDKSDESMLTDYEELLQKLGDQGSDLLNYIDGLVNSFLTENPKTIKNEILDEWEEHEVPDRLLFDTPIPLAEEQRKIIAALNKENGRFVTVEGPPGTGKSHTISAIAFGAILRGQSILVLSDKKEALDVVENKLNDTLAKVRPSDSFVNPILRLGRVGTNFKRITTRSSIENIRTQHREINKEREQRQSLYTSVFQKLKSDIKEKSTAGSKIDLQQIFAHEKSVAEFKQEWSAELDQFDEIFDARDTEFADELASIKLLLDLRTKCQGLTDEEVEFVENFGDDAEALAESMAFLEHVKGLEKDLNVFNRAPEINKEKVEALTDKINEVRASKGFFGYIFAGSKIDIIKNSVDALIGYRPRKTNDELISELRNLVDQANSFFKEIEDNFPDCLELIPYALHKELPEPFSASLMSDLNHLHEKIEEELLPFLGEDETTLEILCSEDSAEANFYSEFSELRANAIDIERSFVLPEYNFLGRKTDIENYNALELATEIDRRVIEFADDHANDARTLSTIISQKKRFPRDKFELLKQSFPCMICSLRDYAEYIPLERELFDLIIIDEASQVSIAQAFPAIIRAKKMIVLGDRKQFGNVKTSNASKELNNAYFTKVKAALYSEWDEVNADLEINAEKLNITNSILDFMENLRNFDIMLKKHFRGYPEMISFSSRYFYGNELQAMKIRGKAIEEVLEFFEIAHDGLIDQFKNTNEQEARAILDRVVKQLDEDDHRSVAVISPFTEQQTLISKIFSEHEKYQDILRVLKFRSFTFDSCQGEERDIVYFSFVASPEKDKLWSVLPKQMDEQDEEELDRSKKLQRMNVAFSRGKEKLVFVHSKPIEEFSAGKEALLHYKRELLKAKQAPTASAVDPNSEAEKRVLEWIQQTQVYLKHRPEIEAQYEIGKYLETIDPNYKHPKYRVDFLLRFMIDGKRRDIIVEYDGFEYHFQNSNDIDAGNWRHYLTEADVEREHVLDSYGYKTIRLNKFNIGKDQQQTINELLEQALEEFEESGDNLIKKVLEESAIAHEGFLTGTFKHCKRCDQNKPKEQFERPSTARGYGNFCNDCVSPATSLKKRKKKARKPAAGKKICKNCKKSFDLSEFLDSKTSSGRRRLCSSCKAESLRKKEAQTREYFRNIRWR